MFAVLAARLKRNTREVDAKEINALNLEKEAQRVFLAVNQTKSNTEQLWRDAWEKQSSCNKCTVCFLYLINSLSQVYFETLQRECKGSLHY